MAHKKVVYIGRFQPLHAGHKATIEAAQKLGDLIVIVGSVNQPRTIKNPFTYQERAGLLREYLRDSDTVVGVEDSLYKEESWVEDVQRKVGAGEIILVGYSKDESSYYLKMFPTWEFKAMPYISNIDATKIRSMYFDPTSIGSRMIQETLPLGTVKFLEEFRKTPQFTQLRNEYEFIRNYKLDWETAPYPPTFVTSDAVVVYCGHILMVKRRTEPGKGLWALPGGFVGQHETVEMAAVRELFEETKIGLFHSELYSMRKGNGVFDHPGRSLRGRTITHAFYFSTYLPLERLGGKLPKVKGSDDAEVAKWFPLNKALAMGEEIFEDHRSIILNFVS